MKAESRKHEKIKNILCFVLDKINQVCNNKSMRGRKAPKIKSHNRRHAMRAVENQIVNYLRNSDFLSDSENYAKSRDFSIRDSVRLEKTRKRVYLWGHCIFTLDKENNIKFSFQGWKTNTTKGRISALISAFCSCPAGIRQKNYQLFFYSSLGEFPIASDKIYTIKNGKPEEVESI